MDEVQLEGQDLPPRRRIASEVIDRFLEGLTGEGTSEVQNLADVPSGSIAKALELAEQHIQALRESFSIELVERVARLGSQRNSLARIHTLPVEVLSYIFDYHIFDWDGRPKLSHFSVVLRLGLVCRAWRTIVYNYPPFWALARSYDPVEALQLAVKHSRRAPLVVTWNSESETRLDQKAFWSVLGLHGARWKTISVKYAKRRDARPLRELQVLEKQGARSLELLGLRVPAADRPIVLDLLGGDAPSLRRISLSGVAARHWDSSVFRGLQSISLKRIYQSTPSLQHIIDILRHSEKLEHFILHDVAISDCTLSLETDDIHLPQLRLLSLQGLPALATAHILAPLHIPRCTDFHYRVDPEDDDRHRAFAAFTTCASPSVQLRLQDPDTRHANILCLHDPEDDYDIVSVWISEGEDINSENATLKIEMACTSTRAAVEWLLHGLLREVSSQIMVALILNGAGGELAVRDTDLASSISRFAGMFSLGLFHVNQRTTEALITRLSQPEQVDNTIRWPAPLFSDLVLRDSEVRHPLLLEMARNRTRGRLSLDGTLAAQGPVSLKRLRADSSGMDESTYAALVEILSDEVVEWYTEEEIMSGSSDSEPESDSESE